MSPIVENLIISLLTGLVAAATQLTAQPSDQPRDWVILGATGAIAFGGAFINGQRQLQKTPPAA